MLTIINKDALRAKVEAESGGQRTVLYTRSGQPSYMFVVPAFSMEAVATGLGKQRHPAFTVKEKAIAEFFYGCYPGSIHNGELLSLPHQRPASQGSLTAFQQSVKKNGRGWHLSTNAEWCALMFLCRYSGYAEVGNTDYGCSHAEPAQKGLRISGNTGENSGNPVTLTASGPVEWHHDGTLSGISDLCGNLWEWQTGARLHNGEIQIIKDNDAATDLAHAEWWAIDLESGALLPPGSPATAKYDSPAALCLGNAGTPILSQDIINFNGEWGDNRNTSGLLDGPFNNIVPAQGKPVATLLQILGFFPWHREPDGDQAYLRNYGQRALLRGGAWYSGNVAGMRTLCLSHGSNHASETVGARPVWYSPVG
ncbi:hypothetical protein [Candidatus Pantoea multigeneris]|uniref:Sulfatase-modifying factor enzyme domain-containing protein n=1 Tax=Candidatus Pantoea multigeneris TaxID=2608357 RepID=A0ABX0R8C7_9GAMM|nr:hypothetical protein [Pantoea multigeneris]NIF21591.1 hypothetical protein [Pantoea multigeneris]